MAGAVTMATCRARRPRRVWREGRCRRGWPAHGREAAAADALQDAREQHDVERGGDAAEERGDGEEGDAGHVVVLAAEDAGEPRGHGQDDGVGDEVGGEDPGDFVIGAAEAAGDVGQGDVGDGGVEQLHEGGEGDGERDDPGIDPQADSGVADRRG